MTRSLLLALALGACAAPQQPAQTAALQHQSAQQACAQAATAASGVPTPEASGFGGSGGLDVTRYQQSYRDCMAQGGFPNETNPPLGT